mmetsp:Transcript_57573/g.134898  ORF Transcript_57573/g.134898 Transcript_57573/m.134898 type:complete len:679 (+) Transcript_57573:39-2075(+)
MPFPEELSDAEPPAPPKAVRRPAPVIVGQAPSSAESSLRRKKKKINPVKQLLKVIRSSKACLIAFEIEETASDIRILRAVEALPEDEILMFFRDVGYPEDVVIQIASLLEEGRPQIAELTGSIFRKMWRAVIQFFVFCTVSVFGAAGVLFITSLGYTEGTCQFSDFTNGTCQQGNICALQVAAWHEQGISYVSAFSPPVTSSESNGLKSFDENGAFRCCNYAQQAAENDFIPTAGSAEAVAALGVGFGSGTSCCNFYHSRTKVFCDNFGTARQFADCPVAPWRCRLKLGRDNGQIVVDELRVWEPPVYVLLLWIAGGMVALILLIYGFSVCSRHSAWLAALSRAVWARIQYVQDKVGCGRHCKRCMACICNCVKRATRLGPTAEERRKEKEEQKEEQERMRQASMKAALRRSMTYGNLELARGEHASMSRRFSLDLFSRPPARPQERRPERRRRPPPRRPKSPKKGKTGRVESLKVQEAEDSEAGVAKSSSASSGTEDVDTSDKSSQASKLEVQPWSIEEVAENEEDLPNALTSRPATVNLQSMLRPIMTPMQPRRHPRILSEKFGLQDPFGSTTTSFASGYVSGYDTTTSFGAISMTSGVSGVSGVRGDAMAQTFTEGFGVPGGRPKQPGDRKRKRRVQDRPPKPRAGQGTQHARTAWAEMSARPTAETWKSRFSEQ